MTSSSFGSAGITGARRDAPFTTRVSSYEIVKRLAEGGMAELFLARARGPQGFEKLVVIKKIVPRLAGDPRFVQLLLDEAKVAACLDHSCIVQVYDLGMLDGEYCFVMEYVHGRDLRTVLRRAGRLPIEHAIVIARDIASALHHAHTRRSSDGYALDIIHRDISPSNIAVSFDGAVKLLDLGVAKASTSSIDTRTGIVSGKVAYMSPEQARGHRVDLRTDLYSLGIVLWEMVTGRSLYRAETNLATAQLVPEAPSRLRPGCPPAFDRLVLRALSHDVDQRFQTARELQVALETFAREHALWLSTLALAEAMHAWFHDEISAWRDAEAGRATLDERTDGLLPRRTTPSGRVLQLMRPVRDPGMDSVTRVLRPPPAQASNSSITHVHHRATTPAPRRPSHWTWAWIALFAVVTVVVAFAITRAASDTADPATAPVPRVPGPAEVAPPARAPITAPDPRATHRAPTHPAAKLTHHGTRPSQP